MTRKPPEAPGQAESPLGNAAVAVLLSVAMAGSSYYQITVAQPQRRADRAAGVRNPIAWGHGWGNGDRRTFRVPPARDDLRQPTLAINVDERASGLETNHPAFEAVKPAHFETTGDENVDEKRREVQQAVQQLAN